MASSHGSVVQVSLRDCQESMNAPIYTAFYTIGTIYEAEAARLRRSLDKFGLPHELVPIADCGSWVANTHRTAPHILAAMERYPDRPIVQLDADAVLWQYPILFDELSLRCQYDIAGHFLNGSEFLNGTLWLAPSPTARKIIAKYAELCRKNSTFANEQQFLTSAIHQNPQVMLYQLPASYCYIHDLNREKLAESEIFIEHLQASRASSGSSLLPNRIKRLEEIEGKV